MAHERALQLFLYPISSIFDPIGCICKYVVEYWICAREAISIGIVGKDVYWAVIGRAGAVRAEHSAKRGNVLENARKFFRSSFFSPHRLCDQ